jgi:LemA protein
MALWIILIIVVAIIGFVISVYNGLVRSKMNVENAWSQIDVQLQRRFDLIPNFVETVKGYMSHEKETLEKITALRTSWANASSVNDKIEIDNQISSALKTIMAVSENYPDLKANQNFINLQEELSDIENKLAASRRYFNSATKEYNIAIQTFPSVLIANTF